MADDISTLRRILHQHRRIAVVGLSAEWHRPSYFASKYMQQHGYTIFPVNPRDAGGEVMVELVLPAAPAGESIAPPLSN